MGYAQCLSDLETAVGRPLTDDEQEAVVKAVQERMKAKVDQGMSARDAAVQVGQQMVDEHALAAMRGRFDTVNNILKRADLNARVIPGEEVKTETSVLQGRASGTGRNFANSVDANHHGLQKQLLGPMVSELEKAGLLKQLAGGILGKRDRAFERDVARELFRRDDPNAGPATKNARAVETARILGDVMDTGRAMMNKEGAFIGKSDNYMGRQYHDMWKVRGDGSEAAYQKWKADTLPKLDTAKMFDGYPPEAQEKSLRATWQSLASGVHDSVSDGKLGGFQGAANLGKKVSEGRSILFKSADDWMDYNDKYGKGGVMDAIVSGADGAARDTALMQQFGTNPKAMFDTWHGDMISAAKARDDFKAVDALKGDPNKGLFDVVTGRAAIPENLNLAYRFATVRNVMQLASLGRVILSAQVHPVIAAGVLRHNGLNFWQAMGGQYRAILGNYGTETQAVAHSLGAGIDGMIGHIVNRFRSEDGIPGAMATSVNVFHKLNGFTYFLDSQRTGMGLALSHHLAQSADTEFADLNPRLQNSMRRYGIEQLEWDHARATAATSADGRSYLMPGNITDPAIGQKFGTMITDTIRDGLNDHTPWARSAATLGTKSGTWGGEIVRSLLQFKGFALTMMQRQMGRELTRDGMNIPGFLYLAVGMTLMGYAANTMGDALSNKTPEMPKDAGGWAQVVTRAMTRGGAFGLLADGLFQDGAHSGGDVMRSLAGPLASKAFDAIAALNTLRDGDQTKGRSQIALREGQKLAGEWVPNLFYTKAAYDYLFPYMFQNMANPGAVQRANRLMRQHGQQFILPP